jgi:RAB6A-GEF complex partner protein 1
VQSSVSVSQILHARAMGIEAWITSDGRAYFVRLHEFDGSEMSSSEYAEDGRQQVLEEPFV